MATESTNHTDHLHHAGGDFPVWEERGQVIWNALNLWMMR